MATKRKTTPKRPEIFLDSAEKILNEIERICSDYVDTFDTSVPFHHLSRRFNRRCIKLGLDLLNVIKGDPRFSVGMSKKTAGYLIHLSAVLNDTYVPKQGYLAK